MSEPTPANAPGDAPSDSPPPPARTDAPAKDAADKPMPSRARKWRRRIIAVLVLLIGLVLAFRLTLVWTLPAALSKTAAMYGLDVRYDRAQIHLLGGDVGLWNFRVLPKGRGEGAAEGEPILHAQYVRGDVSVIPLLKGRVHVMRAEADGVDLVLERTADGRIPLLDALTSASPAASPAGAPGQSSSPAPSTPPTSPSPSPAAPAEEPARFDFTAPVVVEALRLHKINARVRDAFVSPALETTVSMDLRLSDLTPGGEPATFELDVWAEGLVDALRVAGHASAKDQTLDAAARVSMRSLRPKALAGYLKPIGLRPVADALSAELNATVKMAATGATATSGSRPTTSPAGIPDAIAGTIIVDGVKLIVDGRDEVVLNKLQVDVGELTPTSVRVGTLFTEGVRASAGRTAGGRLRAAGFELVAAAPAPVVAPAAAPVGYAAAPVAPGAPSVIAAAPPPAVKPFHVALGEVLVRDVQATFRDEAVSPAGDLRLGVTEMSCRAGGGGDLLDPDATLDVAVALVVPGVARAVELTGNVRPRGESRTAELAVRADGVRPDALRPYLEAIGVQSLLNDATFTAKVQASVGPATAGPTTAMLASARLYDVSLTDGAELLTFAQVDVRNASIDTAAGACRVEAVEVIGPSLELRRKADGTIETAGVRVARATAAPAPAPAAPTAAPTRVEVPSTTVPASNAPPAAPQVAVAAPPASQPAAVLPRVEIGRLTWKGVRLKLVDESAPPQASSFAIDDAGIELSDLLVDLGGRDTGATAKPGKLKVWLAAPELADQLQLDGSLTPGARSIVGDLRVTGRGMDLTRLASYLEPLGIEPTMRRGSLDAEIKASVSSEGERLRGSVDVTNVKLAEGDDELVGVDALRVADAEMSSGGSLSVGEIEMRKPRAVVTRDADGSFVAVGVRVRPGARPGATPAPTPAPARASAAAAPVRPSSQTAASPTAVSATASKATGGVEVAATQPSPAEPAAISLLRLFVEDADIRWNDLMMTPAVHANLRASVRAERFVLGRPAPPGAFDVKLSSDKVVDELNLKGTLDLTPDAPAAVLNVDGRGIRGGPLAAYLPPGIEPGLKDGRLRVDVKAGITENPAGGQSYNLAVTGLDYRDGAPPVMPGAAGAATPLLAMKSLTATAPRVDMAGDVIAVSEVSVAGFETNAHRDADGATRLLGFVMRPAGTASAEPAVPPAMPATQPDSAPARRPVPATGPTTTPASPSSTPAAVPAPAPNSADADREIARLVAEARRPLPLFTLDKLDVNATRVEWTDASKPGSKPLLVRDLRVRNLARVELGGPKAETLPPVKIEVTTAVQPVAKKVVLRAQAAPFALEPAATLDLDATGISGSALTDLMPDLASKIDGAGLTDGRFRTQVQANAKFERRGPRDFDLSRGFQLELAVNGLAFTDGPDGPVLAGVESLRADAVRVEPANGRVHAKVIEITKPAAIASRDADGIHLLGLVLKTPEPAATQPATAPTAARAMAPAPVPAEPPPATESTAAPSPSTAPKSEVRVDRLMISGVDVPLEDRTAEPHLVVPLNNLDVEVRGFTTLALSEPRPIRFSAVVGADKVTLPKRAKGAGIAGAVGDVVGLIGGTKKEALTTDQQIEDRELFSQITSAGNLVLYPVPTGYVKSSVSGFELASLGGLASQAGIGLSGGVFDSTVEAYFRDDGSLDTRNRFVFTDLAVEEPPNGPIARHLAFPAPLDVVLAAVRDADGSITLPINAAVDKGQVNKAAVVSSAVGAIGGVIATAIASSPVKAVTGVGDLIGVGSLLGGGKEPREVPPVELTFGTGDATLDNQARQRLAELIALMRKDETVELTLRSELGAGDVKVASARANPSPEDAQALAQNLRSRKAELVDDRRELAARARAELASLSPAQVDPTLARLRDLDRQIAAADDASDLLWDILRPGADRQASRRTRAASLQMAQQRLAASRDALAVPGVPLSAERVRVTNATFNPQDGESSPGKVIVTVVRKKRQQ